MNNIWPQAVRKVLGTALMFGVTSGIVWAQAPKPATPTPLAPISRATTPPAEAPVPANKVVLKVGNRQFTKADIDLLIADLPPQMQRNLASPDGKKSLGDQYSVLVALSEQAEAQHLEQSPEFVQRLAFQKDQLAAQAAYETLTADAKVTPEEVQAYYNAHADEYDEITVRQIIVRKKVAEATSDPAHPTAAAGPGLEPDQAKARAEAIRKEILAGTDIKKVIEDFKAPGDVIIDAEPRTVRHGGMRPDMEKVAFSLKDGEVSESIDVPQALILFQLIKHSHSDVKDVSAEIEKKLRQDKVEASINGVKKNANIWMDEDYFGPAQSHAAAPTLGPPPAKP
jgi:peptidyl-prolyl cis-trans isomerase C